MRRPAALLAGLLAVALAPAAPAGAIVGGDAADAGEWPWQVALVVDGGVLCGGSLVALDVVVTAAHCTDGLAAADLSVVAGTIEIGAGGQERAVSRLAQHEEYDPDITRNDISLLVLDAPFEAGDGVQPATVAHPTIVGPLLEGLDDAVVTGFGATSEEGLTSPVLREAEVDVIDDATCVARYAEDGDQVFAATQVCAGFDRGHVDACYGDSGGPLVVPADEEGSEWFLVGIVSWGAGCGRPLRPTVYTEVTAYLDWIEANGGPSSLGGTRFTSEEPLRLPAVGASAGKAARYPATLEVDGADGTVDANAIAVELHGLSHERLGDLDIWLEAPDGTVVTLLSDVAFGEVEDIEVAIAAGTTEATGGDLPVRVSPTDLEPDQQRKGAAPPATFEALQGVPADGEWSLLVADDADGATGSLTSWSLVLG